MLHKSQQKLFFNGFICDDFLSKKKEEKKV